MHSKTTSYLLAGQISLVLGLFICFLLLPEFYKSSGGMSNYGVHSRTVVPFSIAFAGAGVMTALAARTLTSRKNKSSLRNLKVALYILASLFIFVLLSTYPYKLAPSLDTLHKLSAILLFVFEIFLASWLTLRGRKSWLYILLLLFLTASLFALLSLLGKVQVLFVAQALGGLAFATLLVTGVNHACKQ